jgi:hypothetical protein
MATARLGWPGRVLRHSPQDGLLVGLSVLHAALLVTVPSLLLVAIGLWWNANTIAHNFIHRPFFRTRPANRLYSAFLSLVLGLPQSIWRERHLAHHAGRAVRDRLTWECAVETLLVGAAWTAAAAAAPHVFFLAYLPGWALGLTLCWLQGHYEHARGTTSHYGRLYNLLFFNDGYHVEHHARPGEHWSRLPVRRAAGGRASRFPPVLRWLEGLTLDGLERLVLRSPALQRFVLRTHERAFRLLLAGAGEIRTVVVVGGGLFPRTAILLRRLLPEATIRVLEADGGHAAIARRLLGDATPISVERYGGTPLAEVDLAVIPLAYLGSRRQIYARPPARAVLVHDWIWSRHGTGVVVSPWLLKRLNLVRLPPSGAAAMVQRRA